MTRNACTYRIQLTGKVVIDSLIIKLVLFFVIGNVSYKYLFYSTYLCQRRMTCLGAGAVRCRRLTARGHFAEELPSPTRKGQLPVFWHRVALLPVVRTEKETRPRTLPFTWGISDEFTPRNLAIRLYFLKRIRV